MSLRRMFDGVACPRFGDDPDPVTAKKVERTKATVIAHGDVISPVITSKPVISRVITSEPTPSPAEMRKAKVRANVAAHRARKAAAKG